jgi:hypothetical protein
VIHRTELPDVVNNTDTLVTDLTFEFVVEFAVAGPSIGADHTDGTLHVNSILA